MLPLLVHLERLEDEEEDENLTATDENEPGEANNKVKRNVSIENYIAWGILQVIRRENVYLNDLQTYISVSLFE